MIRLNYFTIILLTFSLQAWGQLDKKTKKDIDKAVEYFNNEDYDKALVYIDKLVEKDSSDYVSWTWKGRVLFNLGNEQEGINAINRAIEINPFTTKPTVLGGQCNTKQENTK